MVNKYFRNGLMTTLWKFQKGDQKLGSSSLFISYSDRERMEIKGRFCENFFRKSYLIAGGGRGRRGFPFHLKPRGLQRVHWLLNLRQAMFSQLAANTHSYLTGWQKLPAVMGWKSAPDIRGIQILKSWCGTHRRDVILKGIPPRKLEADSQPPCKGTWLQGSSREQNAH